MACAAAILFTTVSCENKEETAIVNLSESVQSVQLKGEKAILPQGVDSSLLNQTDDEFTAYLYSKASTSKNARFVADGDTLSYDEIIAVFSKYTAKYPSLSYNTPLSESDKKRIYLDFPEITSEKGILEKLEVIYHYYNSLCRLEASGEVVELLTRSTTKSNGRALGLYPTEATKPELVIMGNNLWNAQLYKNSGERAIELTDERFSSYSNKFNNQPDAYRHGMWTGISIRRIVENTPANKQYAFDWVAKATSAHEKKDEVNGAQQHDPNNAMDLFNNMAARNWMDDRVKVNPFQRKTPSETDINNNMYDKANWSTVHTKAQILDYHGGDTQYVWDKLYNNIYRAQEFLVGMQ